MVVGLCSKLIVKQDIQAFEMNYLKEVSTK
jgi:hypothetical protein